MPRKRTVIDDGRFDGVFAQMQAAGIGAAPSSPPAHEASRHVTETVPTVKAMPSDKEGYNGLTRVEKLFRAIDRGDAETIRATMSAKHLRNKDGTNSDVVIEPALSLLPDNREAQHFPEPLLQRAVRSEKMASVQELVNMAHELPKDDQDKFFNARRSIDGATVLHDLAASIPAEQKVDFSNTSTDKWNPGALISQFTSLGTDVLAKSDGKTAADAAPNAQVKAYLEAAVNKALAEDEQQAMRWQARLAREQREQSPDGGHLSRIR